ncbi:MAG: hypothetical protein ACLP8S_00865 [Solirubrobacteraceae bacterium]
MLAEHGTHLTAEHDRSTREPVARYDGLADRYDRVMRDTGNRGELAASAYAAHYVSICVHPCFNGGDATRNSDGSVSIRPEYAQAGYRTSLEFGSTIRSHVGAWHRPLADLVNTYLPALTTHHSRDRAETAARP